MPNATKLPSGLSLAYRIVHRSQATTLEEASKLATAYFTDRRYTRVEVIDGAKNGLGNWDFKLAVCLPDSEARQAYTREQVARYAGEFPISLQATNPIALHSGAGTETLTCEECGTQFARPIVRGRKPRYCPEHATQATATKPIPAKNGGTEQLTCGACGQVWSRPTVRGVKPKLCPECKATKVEGK